MNLLSEEILNSLPERSREEIDELGIGIIKVDDRGVIEIFSTFETKFSGVEASAAEGRNFFTQVAPCTNNSLFYGRFKRGIKAGELNHTMPYTYTYKMRPTNVTIQLFRHNESGTNWIITKLR